MADAYGIDRNGPQVTISVGSARLIRKDHHQYRFTDLMEVGTVLGSWSNVQTVIVRTPDPRYIEMGRDVAVRLRKGWGLKTKYLD